MTSPLPVALLCLVAAANAQSSPTAPDALHAARAKLGGALKKAATTPDTAFEATWGPDKKKKGARGAAAAAVVMGMTSPSGRATGSWHRELQHLRFDGDAQDQLLVAGDRTLASADGAGWRLRTGRFADGNPIGFQPDVPLLLQMLSDMELAVTHRAVDALDDRPVEVIAVTLNADQVAELVWAGAMPEPSANGVTRMFGRPGAGAARPAAKPPNATVDLAMTIDPATSVLHQIHMRSWAKEEAGGAGVFIVRAGGAGVVADEEEEAETPAPATAAGTDAAMVYEQGLPVRPRKKISVADYTVRLLDHGRKTTPPLGDEQKRLLGR